MVFSLHAYPLVNKEAVHTHSVSSSPGKIAFTLILGPCVTAKAFIRCNPGYAGQSYAFDG